jgi:quercetin dioxygenase-like cupin family protein
MNRRLFVQIPLLTFTSELITGVDNQESDRLKKGFKVESGRDRFQKELHIMGGQFNCLVSAKDTNGDFCAYDTFRSEKGGPAFHLHHNQDEWFYNIKGEFIVKVGDDKFNLKPGDSLFAPRQIPHAFAKINDGEAQMLVLFQPAGSMEDFFKQISQLGENIPKDQEHVLKELYRKHGMEVVGPPLEI